MNHPRREIRPLAVLLSGFLLWSTAFLALYAIQATGCRLGWHLAQIAGPLSLQRTVLLCLLVLFLAGHAVLIGYTRSRATAEAAGQADAETSGFLRTAARHLALFAAAASVICFGGILWLTPC